MSAFYNGLHTRIGDQYTCQGVNLSIGVDGPGGSVRSTSPAWDGTRSSSSDAVAMAAVVYKITGGIGRSARGRSMLPGVLAETDVGANGTIDSTPKAAILAGYLTFLDDLVDQGVGYVSVPPVLLHSDTVEMAPSPILSGAVREKVGWVRGRLF
jgi:hypothetical protein